MDKYEYKVRSDEIKSLIGEGNYAQAAEIADTIDWRRVKSVMMLCTVSDLYKINRRYEDAKNMLLLAYERRPGGRTICYALCELCIKTEEFMQALKYFKEFVQVAPRDTGRFILQYKLYEAQEVSLEERIGVLEELKKRDYREKWAYELAYLYHRVGLGTRCVEECDELILWFGEGKYVVKAMELKMLHQPLTPAQQEVYDHRFDVPAQEEQPELEGYAGEEDYGQESMEGQPDEDWQSEEAEAEGQETASQEGAAPAKPDEMDIQVKTVDVGQYNTINLQAELAAGLQEVLGADGMPHMEQPAGGNPAEAPGDMRYPDYGEEEIEDSEVFFGATGELEDASVEMEAEYGEEAEEPLEEDGPGLEEAEMEQASPMGAAEETGQGPQEESGKIRSAGTGSGTVGTSPGPAGMASSAAMATEGEQGTEQLAKKVAGILSDIQPPRELADVLSQEANGQISIVLPESTAIEKQITGQMKLEDILAEWERIKKENEAKCQEDVRRHVQSQTGPMFTEFDAAVRDGLLEQLEKGAARSLKGQEQEAAAGPEELAGELPEAAEAPRAGEAYMELEEGQEPEELQGLEEEPLESVQEPEEYGPEEQAGLEGYLEPEELQGLEEEPLESVQEPEEYGPEEQAGLEGYLEPEDGYWEPDELPEEPVDEYIDSEELPDSDEYMGPEELPDSDEYLDPEALPEPEAAYGMEAEEPDEAQSDEEPLYLAEDGLGEEVEDRNPEEAGFGEEEEGDSALAVERERAKVRSLTREEKELFAPFIQSRRSREQLVKALDSISMAAYTGNLIITGEEGMDTLTLAKNMMREIRMIDRNFSGRVAKVSGEGLNGKNVAETLEQLNNGALIVQKASGMSSKTAAMLHKQLQHERFGIIVVLEDTEKAMKKLFLGTPELYSDFTARINLEALSNDTLVAFGRQYAREKEFSIDNLGILALHTRIEEMQTIDHVVTVIEVKQIVDEAIRHASRKTFGHFFDVLLAKRYDDEDMIILTEKDFVA